MREAECHAQRLSCVGEPCAGVRAQANAALLPLITQAHRESRQTYGSPRLRIWLQQRGPPCGRQRISKLMRVAGLSSRPRRRFRPASLTDSNHDLPVAPNRLRELAAPKQRDAIWVADITCVETTEGWLYVAGVLDRCTRRCVGWAMADTLATTLPWPPWTWRRNNAAPRLTSCIIRIVACNMPARHIGNDWHKRASSPA
jgi:putative transposase